MYNKKENEKSNNANEQKLSHDKEKMELPFWGAFWYADRIDFWLISSGVIASALSGAVLPLFALIFGSMINELAKGGSDLVDTMSKLALYMTILGIGFTAVTAVQVSTWLLSAYRQVIKIKKYYLKAALNQEIAWHDTHKAGDLNSRVDSDTKLIRNGINDKLGLGVSNVFLFFAGYALAFTQCWELSLVLLGSIPFIMIIGGVFAWASTVTVEKSRAAYAKAGEIAAETLSNVRTTQIFGKEHHEEERYMKAAEPSARADIMKTFFNYLSLGIFYFYVFILYGICFWFTAYLIEWNRTTVDKAISAFIASLFSNFGIGFSLPSLQEYTIALKASQKIFYVIERKPLINIEDTSGIKLSGGLQDEISFNNVKFNYPSRPDSVLFTDLCLKIKKGTTVAFSGASGSGKSSIIQLVQRLYDTDDGEINVDGVNIKDLNLYWWREQIAIVSQEPNLFSGSILENIRVGSANATIEEIEQACKRAQVYDVIMNLPDRFETDVGSAGSHLSGGQKQRIAIARALVRQPSILILDEATSALDRRSEVEVQAAIDAIMNSNVDRRLTVIIIAHRISTIRKADIIYYITHDDNTGSSIAEQGTYKELLDLGGHFSIMVKSAEHQRNSNIPVSPMEIEETEVINNSINKKQITEPDNFESNECALPFTDEKDYISRESSDSTTGNDRKSAKTSCSNLCNTDSNKGTGFMRLLRMNRDCWRSTCLGFVSSAVTGAIYPLFAIFLSYMFDTLTSQPGPEMRANAVRWGIALAACGVGMLAGYVLMVFYAISGEELTKKLRRQLYRSILRQDMVFFDSPGREPGALCIILSSDTEAVHQLFGPTIGLRLQMFLNIATGVIIGFIFCWKAALVTMVVVPIQLGSVYVQGLYFSGVSDEHQAEEGNLKGEALTQVRTVVAFNMQERISQSYNVIAKKSNMKQMKNCLLMGLLFSLGQFSIFGCSALAYWYGGKLIAAGEFSFLEVMVAAQSIIFGAQGAGEAGGFQSKVADAKTAARRVFEIIDRVPSIDPEERGLRTLPPGPADVKILSVHFRYPSRPHVEVLKGVSMHVKANSSVGFAGETGCGKSSTILLLARLYNPNSGEILARDIPLRELDLVQWRRRIAVVFQEPALFSGTIRENIAYSLDDPASASEEAVKKAATMAGIHEEILSFPAGYETEVGYLGRQLSGGQKQRVAIARALMREPDLLLLDEATSALDNKTETVVLEGLHRYNSEHNCTIVSIAHRLTTIMGSDKIIVMTDGRITEQGTHEDLLKSGGDYSVKWKLFQDKE